MRIGGSNSRAALLVSLGVVVGALMFDMLFSRLTIYVGSDWALQQGVTVFGLILTASMGSQFVLLYQVKQKTRYVSEKSALFASIRRATFVTQSILVATFIALLVQMFLLGKYNAANLIAAVTISCGLAIALTGVISWRFFSWYKRSKDTILLFYGISTIILCIHSALTLSFVDIVLYNTPSWRSPFTLTTFTSFDSTTGPGIFVLAYTIFAVLSFLAMWLASAKLLRYHFKKVHGSIYWLAIGLPLVYFLGQFIVSSFKLLDPLFSINLGFYAPLTTLIFSISLPIGGLLFGIAFWLISRKLGMKSNQVRNFLVLLAFGFIMFFVSNQNFVISADYPPFGLISISFLGLSAFIILTGFYTTALSLSHDLKLRTSMRQEARKEISFLNSIGNAEMEIGIQAKVLSIVKKQSEALSNESGIDPTLNVEDAKEYLQQVITELRKELKA